MTQLVPKEQRVRFVDLLPAQAEAYKGSVEEYRRAVAARRTPDTTGNPVDLLPRRQMASIFTHLRKVANHPLLVRRLYSTEGLPGIASVLHRAGAFGDTCSKERVLEEISEYSDFTLHQLCVQYGGALEKLRLSPKECLESAKCRELAKLLPRLLRKGHRPLIFSQWTAMLDILEWVLDELNLSYVRLDGSTQVRERQDLVDRYNSDTSVFAFLLSTRAGGQGLNLTGADTVILHDVDFNPQVDRQAEDRCHRIGQTRPVTIYRLVAKETVDEGILGIAQRKLVLDAALLGEDPAAAGAEGEARTMADILGAILGS
eukprot:TRINITY_DN29369_c0_g1_i1.p1 TRINITY_DN29369_c0_g1~~TRINITY_DN29369_c0_g1_i1.p1  ORF type:complete len:347 (+),score=64.37 TRINITY_DN29369_c0_g1_i1:96-1043(+)